MLELCHSNFQKLLIQSHHVVSEKLKLVPNINPYIVNWVIDFLRERSQRVCVDNLTAPFLSINQGVPQGTVLGPVLFTIMVNDISLPLKRP